MRHPATLGGTIVQLYITADDADTVVAQAEAAGAEILRPVADAYSAPHGQGPGPFGHNWFVVNHTTTS